MPHTLRSDKLSVLFTIFNTPLIALVTTGEYSSSCIRELKQLAIELDYMTSDFSDELYYSCETTLAFRKKTRKLVKKCR